MGFVTEAFDFIVKTGFDYSTTIWKDVKGEWLDLLLRLTTLTTGT
jgi:hypothetical protein